jgi:divalent metal cation (Fe/Co/Zn/Cd) transporter
LVGLKVFLAVAKGSLGILSEAPHSGLDLIAAILTWFSVRVSDRPADSDHTYGHGKIESFSAFVETGLPGAPGAGFARGISSSLKMAGLVGQGLSGFRVIVRT